MTRRSSLKAILFDLDGTLIDSAPDLGAAADKLRTDRGLPSLDPLLYRPHAGAGARGMLKVAFDMTPDHPEFPLLREAFFTNYERAMTVHTVVFEGVNELLDSLHAQGLLWGVVTNKMARFTDPLIQAMPLFSTASAVVSGDTTPHSKPHPAPLLEAARRLNVDPSQCIYVGDDERDIQAGRAAGMMTVAAGYGYLGHQADHNQWNADHSISHPLALLKLLEMS